MNLYISNDKNINYKVLKEKKEIPGYREIENTKMNFVYCILVMQAKIEYMRGLFNYYELNRMDKESLENTAFSFSNMLNNE
jgi:hypothetical protein